MRSRRGAYFHPHLGVAWQLSTIIFLSGMQARVWGSYAQFKGKNSPFLFTFAPMCWFPLWLAGWLASWALAVSKASLATHESGLAGVVSSPRFLNVHFLVGPVLALTAVLVASIKIYVYFHRLAVAMGHAVGSIERLASTWTPNESAVSTLATLKSEVGPSIERFFNSGNRVAFWFQISWRIWFALALYLNIVICSVAFVHIRWIKENIIHPLVDGTSTSRRKRIRGSLLTLSLAVFCVAGTGFTFCGLSGWLAFSEVQGPSAGQEVVRIQLLLGLVYELFSYIFVVFGLLGSAIFFTPAATGVSSESSGSRGKGSKSRTLAVNVEITRTTKVSHPESSHQPQSFRLALVAAREKVGIAQVLEESEESGRDDILKVSGD
ncbi:hypothetical protein P7C70_g4214, partial [Phenoliferia sp. Uapishka_3]